MSKTKKVASVAFTGVAAMAAAGLHATPAFAGGGVWHAATNGTPYTGGFHANNVSGPASLFVGSASLTLTCSTSTADATGQVKATAAAGSVATITNATFGTASSPCAFSGINFVAHLTAAAHLVPSSSSTVGGHNLVHGNVTGVAAQIDGQNIPCRATVTGTVSGVYDNTTHVLTLGPNHGKTLTTATSNGLCFGVLAPGQSAGFEAAFKVLSPSALTITDP
jgi:hypothetical protein